MKGLGKENGVAEGIFELAITAQLLEPLRSYEHWLDGFRWISKETFQASILNRLITATNYSTVFQ